MGRGSERGEIVVKNRNLMLEGGNIKGYKYVNICHRRRHFPNFVKNKVLVPPVVKEVAIRKCEIRHESDKEKD
jgi:hypothetical protein